MRVKELNFYHLLELFVQNDAVQTGISKNKPRQNKQGVSSI